MAVTTFSPDPRATAAAASVVARLIPRMDADPLLAELGTSSLLRVGPHAAVSPSGVDAGACVIARVLAEGVPAVAMTFPRGLGPQPAFIGMYLTLWRHVLSGRLCGSVSVATRQSDLVRELRDIRYDGAKFEQMAVGRLVPITLSGGTDHHGRPMAPRKRAAIRPLAGRQRSGLSERDGHLLFHQHKPVPPMAKQTVSMMVVDTVGASRPWHGKTNPEYPDAWTRMWDDNLAANRSQVWLGELGDPDFLTFCSDRDVPVVQFDWPLLRELALTRDGQGSSVLSSRTLCRRAVDGGARVTYHVVRDDDREALIAEALDLLRKLRRRGRDEHAPPAVNTAYTLLSRTSRAAATLRYYEVQSGRRLGARTVQQLLDELEATTPAAFTGRNWKDAHHRYWSLIVSLCRRVVRMATAEDRENAKFVAIFERIAQAQAAGERIRLMTTNDTDRFALRDALRDLDITDVDVASPRNRLHYGPAEAADITLMVAPPPPWQAHLLLTGEAGRLEVLCYPHEVGRLRSVAGQVAAPQTVVNANHCALDRLSFAPAPRPAAAAPHAAVDLVAGAQYNPASPDEAGDEPEAVAPERSDLWRELLDMWGQDIERDVDVDDDDDEDVGSLVSYCGYARKVTFTDGSKVLLRDDGDLDVLTVDEDDGHEVVVARLPGQLEAGDTIAFLPGAGRRSLLDILMDAHDERLEAERRMVEPLYRRALQAAVDKHGVAKLAEMVGRTKFSVWDWLADRATPGSKKAFLALLEASGDQEALAAQAPIWEYMSHKRGVHRYIGRLMRMAMAETLRNDADGQALASLQRTVGRQDLEELFDDIELLTVARVGPPEDVPLRFCGRYLDLEDPTMAAFMRQRGIT